MTQARSSSSERRKSSREVEGFKREHPRFDELHEAILEEIHHGYDLATAYQRAERAPNPRTSREPVIPANPALAQARFLRRGSSTLPARNPSAAPRRPARTRQAAKGPVHPPVRPWRSAEARRPADTSLRNLNYAHQHGHCLSAGPVDGSWRTAPAAIRTSCPTTTRCPAMSSIAQQLARRRVVRQHCRAPRYAVIPFGHSAAWVDGWPRVVRRRLY